MKDAHRHPLQHHPLDASAANGDESAILTVVHSIGHSTLDCDVFLALLERHGIATVVDVRTSPYSRFALHFNQRELRAALRSRGIGYAFGGEKLGGRPSDPALYKNGVVPEGHADYLNLVDYPAVAREPWFREGVERLLELAADAPTAMMCSEEDPNRCHRHHLVAQALLDRGVGVRHIRKDGRIEDAVRLEPPVVRETLFDVNTYLDREAM